MNRTLTLLIALLSLTLADTAAATTVDFDFTRGKKNIHGLDRGKAHTFEVTAGDLTLVVSDADNSKLHRNNRGLGVVGRPLGKLVGRGESILFEFKEAIQLLEVTLWEVGLPGLGAAEIILENGESEVFQFNLGLGRSSTHVFEDLPLSSQFEIRGVHGGFRVQHVHVAAAVPAPASLWMTGLGFAFMLVGAKRKRH